MGWLNNLKSRLIKNGWGNAIELLNYFKRFSPLEFEEWKKTGSTILLKQACWKFRMSSIYNHRTDKLPFENDVDAIDSCYTKPKKEVNNG